VHTVDVIVIARFNPLKKFGPLTGRTRGSPLPMRLYRKKKKSGGGFRKFEIFRTAV
jgi:hypothetical protein